MAPLLAQTSAPVQQLLRNAAAAQQSGDMEAAVRDYQEVLKLRPGLASAQVNLGTALAQLGRFDEAIVAYSAVLAKDPNESAVRLNLAQAYYKKGDLAAAVRELQRVPAARDADGRAALLLGDTYLRLGENAQALATLESAAKSHADNPQINYLLSMALIHSGSVEQGAALAERVAKTTDSPDAYVLAGVTQYKLGQIGPARENLDRAVQLAPDLPGLLAWDGLARDKAGDEEGAKDIFRKALQANADDFEANLHYGAILYREKDNEAARPYLERALRLQPSSVLAQYAMALVKAETKPEDAVSDLEKVVVAAPNWVEPHVKLASVYYRLHRKSDGDREAAIVDRLNAQHIDAKIE